MGQNESRAISDVGLFALNFIENPSKTISNVASNPKGAVYDTKSTVLNEGQKPATNTTNYQAYDPAEDLRKAFEEVQSFRETEKMGSTNTTTTPNQKTSPSGKTTTSGTALIEPTGKKV